MRGALDPGPRWQLGSRELAGDLAAQRVRAAQGYAALLDTVAELDRRGTPEGCGSVASFVATSLLLSLREARELLAQARQELPLARKALAAGEITEQHFTEIARIMAHAPDWLTPHTHTATEEPLLTVATQAAIGTVRKVGRRVRHYWDMDGAEPRDRERDLARPLREFRYHWTRTGRFSFTGELDPDTGTLIEQLMVPLAAPDATDPSGTPDPRTPAERHGDAFTAIIELAAHTPDLPIKAGERAVATITINLHDLQNTAKTVLLDDGTAQPISVIRRMLCDAKIYPAVLGGDGQVLDLGRSARTAPPSLRRALAIRDRGCTFPGCPLGPKWTDVHHTTHWAHGGTTDPTTCTLTCTRHHRLAHHSNWTITITNNTVYWTPPTLIDPHQKPLRNTAHDPPPTQMRAA